MVKNENIVNGFDFGALPVHIGYVGQGEDEVENGKQWGYYLWNVTINYKSGYWTIPYKCGLGHVEKKPGAWPMPNPPYRKGTIAYAQWKEQAMQPKKPKVSDAMYSLLLDMEAGNMSFNDWCDAFGYSNDSMKAFKIYQTCCEYAANMRKAFTAQQISDMKTALDGY